MARFIRRERIAHASLREAVERAERGLIHVDLGGGLIKQRVARPGKGRSGGYRTIIAYRRAGRAGFRFGFAKSERENIEPDELAEFAADRFELVERFDRDTLKGPYPGPPRHYHG